MTTRADSDTPSSAFMKAARTMLRPLVQGLIRRGVPLPQLVEELKALYVEGAVREAAKSGRVTQSAVSVMTGVHRKDVKRLMEQGQASDAPPAPASLGSRLAGLWLGQAPFADEAGHPLPLYEKCSDGTPSFEELVSHVSRDVRSRAVLDDWLRLNIAVKRDDGKIEFNTEAFVAPEGEAEALHFFGRNLRDHVAAGLHNLAGQDPRFIDRAVFYWGLSDASVERLRLLAQDLGAEAIREANREALHLSSEDRAAGKGSRRMTFGVYFYSEPDDPETDTSGGAGRAT
ncbi:MAG: DUF6502 family protein [Parvibaculaceae bacterium]